jgi:23S rRNA (uracil1939-C5)-methyltransferase
MAEETITIEIEKLVLGGEGLGRYQGAIVLVPYAVPGETVRVTITERKKDYLRGRIDQVLTPAQDRRSPPCPVFGLCGGCAVQHLPEPVQIRYKEEAVREVFQRIGKQTTLPLLPTLFSEEPFYYRSRVRLKVASKQSDPARLHPALPVEGVRPLQGATPGPVREQIGFYQHRSHKIVPIQACPLLMPEMNRLLAQVQDKIPLDGIDEIEMQCSPSGEHLLILSAPGSVDRKQLALLLQDTPLLKGIVIYTHQKRICMGDDTLLYPTGKWTFRVSDQSFFQSHFAVNEMMIKELMTWISEPKHRTDRLLELYSGVGNFTLPLADTAGTLTAIEENRFAISDAQWNISQSGHLNISLRALSVETGIQKLLLEKRQYDQIFLDPPREGIHKETLMALPRFSPTRILYLSCNPATLARDIQLLCREGYRLTRLQPFDLFPQTGQIELLAEVVREGPQASSL